MILLKCCHAYNSIVDSSRAQDNGPGVIHIALKTYVIFSTNATAARIYLYLTLPHSLCVLSWMHYKIMSTGLFVFISPFLQKKKIKIIFLCFLLEKDQYNPG